jgi:hypothetical protein
MGAILSPKLRIAGLQLIEKNKDKTSHLLPKNKKLNIKKIYNIP